VQFGIDFNGKTKSIRPVALAAKRKSCIASGLVTSGRIFQLDKFFGSLIALPDQMSFHPALTGNNGFCVRKIREQEQSWEANS
jgi:hypothetical protein